MKKLDRIINESVNSYVNNIINEDALNGYEEANEPKNIFIQAVQEQGLNITSDEGTEELEFENYTFTIDYYAHTDAYYSEGDDGDYFTPPSGGDLMNEDSARLEDATVHYYMYNEDTDEEKEGEIEIDDELLEIMNDCCDFDTFNSEYAQSFDDWDSDMRDMMADERMEDMRNNY